MSEAVVDEHRRGIDARAVSHGGIGSPFGAGGSQLEVVAKRLTRATRDASLRSPLDGELGLSPVTVATVGG